MAEKKTNKKEPGSKLKSTVRKRKENARAAIQRYLPIAEIRNDTVMLKNGGLRAVLEVEALNFNLKSETEQQGIISGYQAFINTLTWPLQIVISSRKVNIDPYLMQIREIAKKQDNELLKNQTYAYANFIEKVVEVADIMTKKFYVIIPLDDEPSKAEKQSSALAQFFSWMSTDDSEAKAVQRYKVFMSKHAKLVDRLNLVESGLNNIGLITRRLNTRELIELYYKTYNPRISADAKMTGDINTASLVM